MYTLRKKMYEPKADKTRRPLCNAYPLGFLYLVIWLFGLYSLLLIAYYSLLQGWGSCSLLAILVHTTWYNMILAF